MSRPAGPVGYYVHHHGGGHTANARAAASALGSRIVGLSSAARPPDWPGEWIALPTDDEPAALGDPTRGGAWHWVPGRHRGFTARMRSVAAWVADAGPSALIVDVSCEVVVLGALLGVPTVTTVLHGRRDDRAHRRAWDSADAIVAPWPASHAEPWQAPWRNATTHLGLLSRHDDRAPPPPSPERIVTVVLPAGGHDLAPSAIDAAARATARDGWRWQVLGAQECGTEETASTVRWLGWSDDPWPALSESCVVVAASGSASVADVAAARRPALLIPQPRPFDEQHALSRHLVATGAPVRVLSRWPARDRWPALLAATAALDPDRWEPLHDRRGGERLAEVVARVSSAP